MNLSPVVWNVAFVPRALQSWYDLLSPEWCRHVFAFGYMQFTDAWVVVDPKDRITEISVLPDGDTMDQWLGEQVLGRAKVLRIHASLGPVYGNKLGNWCTQSIARLVGARKGAWRPIALYRELLAMGARPAFQEPADELQGRSPQRI